MYTIKGHSNNGRGNYFGCTPNFFEVEKKALSFLKRKIPATFYRGETLIGRVWKEGRKWYYYLETEK
jgi:hypothetical protein